jgi:hypothetical protein
MQIHTHFRLLWAGHAQILGAANDALVSDPRQLCDDRLAIFPGKRVALRQGQDAQRHLGRMAWTPENIRLIAGGNMAVALLANTLATVFALYVPIETLVLAFDST